MENNRNFFITIALSVLILTLWQVFYMNPRIESEREAAAHRGSSASRQQKKRPAPPTRRRMPATGSARPHPAARRRRCPAAPAATAAPPATRDAALAATARVTIDTPSLSGSINLTGGRIDDLRLKHYHLTVDKNSPTIELLNPVARCPTDNLPSSASSAHADDRHPARARDTSGRVDGNPDADAGRRPVTLTYTNDKGLTFKRTIAVDDELHVHGLRHGQQQPASAPVSLSNYGRVTRFDKPTHRQRLCAA